jgi:hypothetical protein
MAEVLRSGGDQHITMPRFVERVSECERESLRSAVLGTCPAPPGRLLIKARHPT